MALNYSGARYWARISDLSQDLGIPINLVNFDIFHPFYGEKDTRKILKYIKQSQIMESKATLSQTFMERNEK